MTDRQSETTHHLLVQIRDLLGDIALSIAKSETHVDQSGGAFYYGRPFRYSDTFRRIESEQNRLEKEHDAEQSRLNEEKLFRILISKAKGIYHREKPSEQERIPYDSSGKVPQSP